MIASLLSFYLCGAQCRGRCDRLVGHNQRHLLLAHSSDLVTTNNNLTHIDNTRDGFWLMLGEQTQLTVQEFYDKFEMEFVVVVIDTTK